MKTIESISIWDKGQIKEACILNAYGTNLQLNNSANFWYGLLSDNMEVLTSGNLTMSGEDYQLWNTDDIAWSYIAFKLNLKIIGDYVATVADEPIIVEESTQVEPESEPIEEEVVTESEPTEPDTETQPNN